jgi:ABC-type oligopeptide transport system substrate-binding subunit
MMDMKERAKQLLKAGKTEKEIEIILAEETEVETLFQTVTTGLKTAWESYKGSDMASLNVNVDNLAAVSKNITQLRKLLEQKKVGVEQPGASTEPVLK